MAKSDPIVIVDDDPDDRFLINEIFRKIEVKNPLKFFSHGAEALEYLTQENVTTFLILCDVNMPVMDGLQLQKAINEDPALKKKSIPFIFLSTTATPSEVGKAYGSAVQGFFEKGQKLEELERRLRLIIEYWRECKHPSSFDDVIL